MLCRVSRTCCKNRTNRVTQIHNLLGQKTARNVSKQVFSSELLRLRHRTEGWALWKFLSRDQLNISAETDVHEHTMSPKYPACFRLSLSELLRAHNLLVEWASNHMHKFSPPDKHKRTQHSFEHSRPMQIYDTLYLWGVIYIDICKLVCLGQCNETGNNTITCEAELK